MLANSPGPIIFGHRGAPLRAPENTLASFRLALEEGAHGFELDTKLTSDQQVVVLHDQTLDRTTNGHGKLVQHSYKQLRELDAGSWFSEKFHGEKVPSLEEVFEMAGGRAVINIELTNYETPNDALVEKVVELIRGYHLEKTVIFSSFLPGNLFRSRQLMPEIPLGLLLHEGNVKLLDRDNNASRIPHDALHPYITDVTEGLIQDQHRRGKKVNTWTVNQPKEILQLASWGVDGLITDDPALVVKVLAETR